MTAIATPARQRHVLASGKPLGLTDEQIDATVVGDSRDPARSDQHVPRPTRILGGTLSGHGVPPNERESGTRPAAHSLGTLVGPSGAAALAALLEHDVPGERVAVVVTGSVLRPEHLSIVGGGASQSRDTRSELAAGDQRGCQLIRMPAVDFADASDLNRKQSNERSCNER
jgi:hypothetical protein